MKKAFYLLACFTAFVCVRPAAASSCTTVGDAISCTGALNTPEDVFLETFTLSGNTVITVQTYGFGGGTNAAGDTIAAGGFDSLVALYSGTATNATALTDGVNPIASADIFTNYSAGCPPAGTMTVGSLANQCGDNALSVNLGPGTYILLLTDAAYQPIGVNPPSSGPVDLTDPNSYTDFTGGVFQTCNNLGDCINDTANFAVDIVGVPPSVPEPTQSGILSVFLAALLAAVSGRVFARQSRM